MHLEQCETTCRLKIDGKTVEATAGSTVLDVARRAGIYIPTLCYHPSISPIGSCRLCVVDVEGFRGLPSSCTLPVEDGMVISTATPRVQEFRKTMLECIVADHPPLCLTCNKNLRCELQEVAAYLGIEPSRLPSRPKGDFALIEDIFFNRDNNLCIRCGRCIRMCHELRGNKVLYFMLDERGLSVGTPLDRSYQDSGCKFCGACVDICPTGALYDKVQSGFTEKEVVTICPYCGVGCQLKLRVKHGKIVQVVPDESGPANHGQACVKGRYGIPEFVHHHDRLTTPLVRKNGVLVETGWDEALSLVSEKLGSYQASELAVVTSAKCTNEENYVAQKFARAVLGTNNVDHCARLCHAPTVAGLARAFGSGAMTNSIAEVAEAGCIISVGSNTTVSHPVIALEVKRAKRRGGKLIVANPMKIDLVDIADIWLRHKPGSDVALLMGMARVIVDEGLENTEFIANRCENYEQFKASLENFNLDFVEEVTGVSRELVVEAARMYATASSSSIIYAMGITQHSHGTDNVISTANLAMLTGNIGKLSAGVNPLRGQNNVQGACDMGALPDVFPGYQKVSDPGARTKFETRWGQKLNSEPGLTLTDMTEQILDGRLKAMYLMGENSVLSEPDAGTVATAFEKLEFFVVQDMYLTETAEKADVVLPATSFAEKDGTFTNTERRVQRIRKAINEIGQSKPDWLITCQIARLMGAQGFDYSDPSEIMDEIAELTPSYGGISFERLDRQTLQWPCPHADHPGTPCLHRDGFVRGKGKFYPLEYKPAQELPDEQFPLVLTTGRSLYHFHTGTMTRRVEGLDIIEPEELVEINSLDAKDLGISDRDTVRVISRRGEVTTRASVNTNVDKGTVFMTFHFMESPANQLTNPALDPVAKIPEYKVCAVRVEKVTEA